MRTTERPAFIALAIALVFLFTAGASAATRSGFVHSGQEIRDIRILGDEWICVVRDPTAAILAESLRRNGALPKFSDPEHWKRILEIDTRIDAIAAEASATTLIRDMNAAAWKVDGAAVRAMSLWVQSTGAFPDPEYADRSLARPRLVEYIYLKLPAALAMPLPAVSRDLKSPGQGKSSKHSLTAPDGSAHLFSAGGPESRCWSIKVNQEGYIQRGPKIAFFGMWLGKAGAMPAGRMDGRSFYVIPDPSIPGSIPGSAPGTISGQDSGSARPATTEYSGLIRLRSMESATDASQVSAPVSGLKSVIPSSPASGATVSTMRDGMPISGEDVCELDFSGLEKPGRYVIYIPGIGSSLPFSIGADVFGNSFFTTMRALYHQRCGVALDREHTAWTRDACHTQTYAAAYPPDNGEIYNNPSGIGDESALYGFRTVESGVEKPVALDAFTAIRATATENLVPGLSGGHHDAADYDRRTRHFALTWYLCGIQELFPDRFTDGQLGIPESGNGVPDILDEAAVDLDLWMKTQTPAGGVSGWIEQTRHPTRQETAASDRSRMYLSLPDRASSFAFAGAAALLSRRLAAYLPARAAAYLRAAEKAYGWASDPANRIKGLSFRVGTDSAKSAGSTLVLYDESPLLSARGRTDRILAAFQLAAATGNKRYLSDFRSAQPRLASQTGQSGQSGRPGQPAPGAPGSGAASQVASAQPTEKTGVEALLSALPDAMVPFALVTPLFGGILEKAEREKLAAAVLREADFLRSGSESLPYRTLWRPASHGYFTFMAWGNVHGGVRAGMEILAWKLTGLEVYREAVIRAADWELGANELGTSMITGLGSVYPVVLQHIQSDRDGIAEPVPGIAPFTLTYRITQSAKKWQFPPLGLSGDPESVYPIMRRRFIHPFLEPSQNEFTIMESIAPQVALFGALIPAGWHPAAGAATRAPRQDAADSAALIYPQP